MILRYRKDCLPVQRVIERKVNPMKAVVIVGGGPLGLALSPVLVRCGASALIPEAREAPKPPDKPQTLTWIHKGLELLDLPSRGTPSRVWGGD